LGPAIAAVGDGTSENPLGLDHCFCIDTDIATDIEKSAFLSVPVRHIATLTHRPSGRRLIVHGSQPGVQVYTANWLPVKKSNDTDRFVQHNAVCLETQHFPDAINRSEAEGFDSVVLRPGEVYQHAATFQFTTV